MSALPTVFHITHPKAGSQWVREILSQCAPKRIVEPKVAVAQFYEEAITPGKIYPAVYVPRQRFEETLYPKASSGAGPGEAAAREAAQAKNRDNFVSKALPVIKFVILRDLRDSLVSLYFSLKVSHPLISQNVAAGRRKLNELDFEDGFLSLIEERGKSMANIQRSWMAGGNEMIVKYEDLLEDESAVFTRIVEHCQIEIPAAKLRRIIERASFQNRAGRARGEEDVTSHHRKGVAGDWRNYFTDRIKAAFKERFGAVLIDTGYETDAGW